MVNIGCPVAPESMQRLFALDDWALDQQHRILDELRAAGPVVWVEEMGAFAVTEYDVVGEALNDPERFSSELGGTSGPRTSKAIERARRELADDPTALALLARLQPNWRDEPVLLRLDPPRHTVHRRLINRLFTPRRVAAMRPRVEEIARELVDQFDAAGAVDVNVQYAVPLPLQVIAEQLGVEFDDLGCLKRWSDDFVAPLGNDRLGAAEMLGNIRSAVEFADHFRPALDERREHPQDDFLTLVAQADDAECPVNDDQRLGVIAGMLSAGNETSTKMISSGVALLAEQPRLAERLRSNPELVPAFVEEVLRLEAPVQGLFRMARHDTELGGIAIPAGSWLWILYASANRSEREYPCAHEVDVERPNLTSHLTFGRGIHYCVGAPLARLEGEVAFRTLLESFQRWEIVDYERDHSYVLHGYRHLYLQFI